MHYRFFTCLFLGLLMASLYSCDKNRVFEKHTEVEGGNWSMDNMATFTFAITDTNELYNMLIYIRNRGDYPYRNLYLFLKLTAPNGLTSTDTINCLLADEKGRWLGKSAGSLWENKIPYKWGVQFPVSGTYTMNYVQAMRHEKLSAITDVGLRIEKHTAK